MSTEKIWAKIVCGDFVQKRPLEKDNILSGFGGVGGGENGLRPQTIRNYSSIVNLDTDYFFRKFRTCCKKTSVSHIFRNKHLKVFKENKTKFKGTASPEIWTR
jgi:hypothetical protein